MKTKSLAAIFAAALCTVFSFSMISCGKSSGLKGMKGYCLNDSIYYYENRKCIESHDREWYGFDDYFAGSRKYTINEAVVVDDEVYLSVTGNVNGSRKTVFVEAGFIQFTYDQIQSMIPAYFNRELWAISIIKEGKCLAAEPEGNELYNDLKVKNGFAILELLVDYCAKNPSEDNYALYDFYMDECDTFRERNRDLLQHNPLYSAIKAGNKKMVEMALHYFYSTIIDLSSPKDGKTAVMVAVEEDKPEIVELLMNYLPELRLRDSEGKNYNDYIEASHNPEIQKFAVPTLESLKWQNNISKLENFYLGFGFNSSEQAYAVELKNLMKEDNLAYILSGAAIVKEDGELVVLDDDFGVVNIRDCNAIRNIKIDWTYGSLVMCYSKQIGYFVTVSHYVAMARHDFSKRIDDMVPRDYNLYTVSYKNKNNGLIYTTWYYSDPVIPFKCITDEDFEKLPTGKISSDYCWIDKYGDTVVAVFRTENESGDDPDYEVWCAIPDIESVEKITEYDPRVEEIMVEKGYNENADIYKDYIDIVTVFKPEYKSAAMEELGTSDSYFGYLRRYHFNYEKCRFENLGHEDGPVPYQYDR